MALQGIPVVARAWRLQPLILPGESMPLHEGYPDLGASEVVLQCSALQADIPVDSGCAISLVTDLLAISRNPNDPDCGNPDWGYH